MASVESIGACSLDFDASVGEFCAKDLTASECTLHSGVAASVHGSLLSSERRDPLDKLKSNGVHKQECSVAEIKLPSYVSISCAINGYPNYSRYCRSRDSSPARPYIRKTSLEPSMLADTTREESHRYSRSHSDCNGSTMYGLLREKESLKMGDKRVSNGSLLTTETRQIRNGSVFTSESTQVNNDGSVFRESKRIAVNKQIQIPLKTGKRYTTEVTFSNGCNNGSVIHEVVENNVSRTERLVLAKEVGNDGTKSLVQQRIESLYGKSVGEDVQVKGSSGKGKEGHVNGGEGGITSRSPTPNGKNHIGSVSPPVFRHLNKDFRKQLQINIPNKKADTTKSKLQNNVVLSSKELLPPKKENGFSSISNGHDECDRIKSMTPPPIKSKSITEDKPSPGTPTEGDGEGYRFLSLIDLEKEKIQAKVRVLEEELGANSALIPEEASGKIRAACGKANLLITQKFEQFRGLCWKHIEETPGVPFYTTASDLAGFWDMVMLQVDDIYSSFKDIDAMRLNDWKEVICEKAAMPVTRIRHSNPNAVSKSNPSTPKRTAKSAELMKAREEARRQLLAAKKKGRQQTSSKEEEVDVEIFAPTTTS